MFLVTKRFGRNESRLQSFKNEQDAEQFIIEKLREDKQFKVIATYCLYEGADLIREYTQSDIPVGGTASSSSSSDDHQTAGGGQGRGSSFTPNPFSTSPKPAGMPQGWGSAKDDEKEKNK